MLKIFRKPPINPRKGSYAIMEFGESLNEYLLNNPTVSVDKDRVLKAFMEGKIDYDLKGIDEFID